MYGPVFALLISVSLHLQHAVVESSKGGRVQGEVLRKKEGEVERKGAPLALGETYVEVESNHLAGRERPKITLLPLFLV